MQPRLVAALVAIALCGCSGAQRIENDPDEIWYEGPDGLRADDLRLPLPMPHQVRERYRAPFIEADEDNSWMVWLTAFPCAGNQPSKVTVMSLAMEFVGADGKTIAHVRQLWSEASEVWGGWFPFQHRRWFRDGMVGKDDFRIEQALVKGYASRCAVLDVGKYGQYPAAGHIWMMRWPRDVAPAGTKRVRVHAIFRAEGSALCHVGMDRYRTDTADPEPVQEVLVSDTYGAEHGDVHVILETGDIVFN